MGRLLQIESPEESSMYYRRALGKEKKNNELKQT